MNTTSDNMSHGAKTGIFFLSSLKVYCLPLTSDMLSYCEFIPHGDRRFSFNVRSEIKEN